MSQHPQFFWKIFSEYFLLKYIKIPNGSISFYRENNKKKLSALDLRPKVKILSVAAVNILTWNWCLFPSLTLRRQPLDLLEPGRKTLICHLLHGCFVWFNNLWPEIPFLCEVILTVTTLIWKSYNFSGTWTYTTYWLCYRACWLLAFSNSNSQAASQLC